MAQDKGLMFVELRIKLETMADIIGADYEDIPFMADNNAWGRTYVDIVEDKYQLKIYDYGHYITTLCFDNVDDLVFEVVSKLITSVVMLKMKGFENGLSHSDRRYRGRLFELYEEYAGKISNEYKVKMEKSIKLILDKHPYRD